MELKSRKQFKGKLMLVRIILAVLLPPVSVFLTKGVSPALFINILLTIIGWVPGIIHAFWIISKEPKDLSTPN